MGYCPFWAETCVQCMTTLCQVWDSAIGDCGAKATKLISHVDSGTSATLNNNLSASAIYTPIVSAINSGIGTVNTSVSAVATAVSEASADIIASVDNNTDVTSTKNDDLRAYLEQVVGLPEEKIKNRSLVVQANMFHEFSFSEEAIQEIQSKINTIGV